jgi:site-specific recombinase XerD
MLAMGADIRQLQIVLGHSSIKTTARYTHMSKRHIAAVASPLDLLGTEQAAVLG